MSQDVSKLMFPIGEPRYVPDPGPDLRESLIRDLEGLPLELRTLVRDLSEDQLDATYRPGSWTVRQLVHHILSSHINGYVRLCLILSEAEPVVRPYDQDALATIGLLRDGPVDLSIDVLVPLHRLWTALLRTVPEDGWARPWYHPESGRHLLHEHLQLYAWHGKHHLEHIRIAIGVTTRSSRS